MRTISFLVLMVWSVAITGNTTETYLNGKTSTFVLNEVTIKSGIFPRFRYADSIIDSRAVHKNSIAYRQKNPGNLRSYKTGKYRTFNTVIEGYDALEIQLLLYVSGNSQWTDSTTTMREYIKIYAECAHFSDIYLNHMCKSLGVTKDTRITNINTDSLAKYHCMIECRDLYNLLYGRKSK